MPHQPTTFVVTDPREFDGDPYEVAERATLQAEALLNLTIQAVEDAEVMARNADLEQQMDLGGQPDASLWADSAAGKRWKAVSERLTGVVPDLGVLRRFAAFNPKRPPKE